MGNDDLTIEILKSIRDELKSHGAKLDQTNERLDRMAHEQIRHATAIVGLEEGQRALVERMGDMAAAIVGLGEGQRAIVGELVKINARLATC